jgi:hypothetical protein
VDDSVDGPEPRMNGSKARITRWLCVGLVFAIGPCAEKLRAQEMTLELDPANTRIEFTLAATLHAVHGTFAHRVGTIHFNPSSGAASGLVVVDATSGDSGNTGRDHKMHGRNPGKPALPRDYFHAHQNVRQGRTSGRLLPPRRRGTRESCGGWFHSTGPFDPGVNSKTVLSP